MDKLHCVMVTDLYPTPPPICCHSVFVFKENITISCNSNSRKLQAVICYVTLYNFHTPFGYYGLSKVKHQSIADLLKKVHQVRKKVFFSPWLKYPNRDK